MQNIIDLSEKQILVTGASSGIGRQTCILLSELGAKVLLISRRKEQLMETVSMMTDDKHAYYEYDLKNIDSIKDLIYSIVKVHGKLHGMVYCAGIGDVRPHAMCTPKYMHDILDINFFAFYELTRIIAKKKYSEDFSKIVAISSVASNIPAKSQSAYAASKAAMDASVIVLASELRDRHITVNSIRPGIVDTPMMQPYISGEKPYNIKVQSANMVKPKEVAGLAAYLLSDLAQSITGSFFKIDGGISLV